MNFYSSGQDTIWVQQGDTSKMFFDRPGIWKFKDNLSDGHYCSYNNDKKYISTEIYFTNHQKNGTETRYKYDSKNKIAEINWLNNRKNGVEIWYSFYSDKKIDHLFTFKNGELDGIFMINFPYIVKGYYKNGFADSIWSYYDYFDDMAEFSDSISPIWHHKDYRIIKGEKILISAWDKQGNQTVINGNGKLTDSNEIMNVTTEYLNGKENGKEIIMWSPGGPSFDEYYYKNGLLIKQILYYEDLHRDSSISEWIYPYPPVIDTVRSKVDSFLPDYYYNKINYNY